MGKYRANMNLAGHPRGTVRELDDSDPKVAAKVKSGVLVRIDGPAPTAKAAKKAPAKKAAAKVEPEPEVEEPTSSAPEPAAHPEPEVEVEGPASRVRPVMSSERAVTALQRPAPKD